MTLGKLIKLTKPQSSHPQEGTIYLMTLAVKIKRGNELRSLVSASEEGVADNVFIIHSANISSESAPRQALFWTVEGGWSQWGAGNSYLGLWGLVSRWEPSQGNTSTHAEYDVLCGQTGDSSSSASLFHLLIHRPSHCGCHASPFSRVRLSRPLRSGFQLLFHHLAIHAKLQPECGLPQNGSILTMLSVPGAMPGTPCILSFNPFNDLWDRCCN